MTTITQPCVSSRALFRTCKQTRNSLHNHSQNSITKSWYEWRKRPCNRPHNHSRNRNSFRKSRCERSIIPSHEAKIILGHFSPVIASNQFINIDFLKINSIYISDIFTDIFCVDIISYLKGITNVAERKPNIKGGPKLCNYLMR